MTMAAVAAIGGGGVYLRAEAGGPAVAVIAVVVVIGIVMYGRMRRK